VCLILGIKAGAVKQLVSEEALMSAQALEAPRFIRKTQLAPNEYRKNFHQIDREVMAIITSAEADQVTPLMSKIYLRLVNAPERLWEREGVLRIEAEVRDEKVVKAWAVLCDLAGVASATASKAIQWMHEQGIIGYFSGKNGVGLRIFLNRAVSSIGIRPAQTGKKILAFPPASSSGDHTSQNEPAFNDSFAVREVSDKDFNSRAPKNGADNERSDKKSSEPTAPPPANSSSYTGTGVSSSQPQGPITLDDVVAKLKTELEPAMRLAARAAASSEHERMREWLENRGLPKAARVAQHEAYNVLRKYGVISESPRSSSSHASVGRSDYTPPEPHPLSPEEITDMAGLCVAMLETKGQSIELTLYEMSAEAGGFLLPEDAPKVREKANTLFSVGNSREGK
jgi:hypothetical protein